MTISDAFTAVLNSVSTRIALIDREGKIVKANRAWHTFARENAMLCGISAEGENYLEMCRKTDDKNLTEAHDNLTRGLRSVIKGTQSEFCLEYRFASGDTHRWFYIRIMRLTDIHPLRLLVTHEEITAIKDVQMKLHLADKELERNKQGLLEKNAALTALLEERMTDTGAFENRILTNIRETLLPYLEKLSALRLSPSARQSVAGLEQVITEQIASLGKGQPAPDIRLTPQESEVADLVRNGKTSQEIAELLNISDSTVQFHRKNLRKKLGISGGRTGLRSYLLSLSTRTRETLPNGSRHPTRS